MPAVTPELIASALVGMMFVLGGFGTYMKTRGSKLDGAYKLERSENSVAHQLERIAQALEDMVAANKDSFQRDARDKLERLEEAIEQLADEKPRRPERWERER